MRVNTRRMMAGVAILALAAVAGPAMAQHGGAGGHGDHAHGDGAHKDTSEPINMMCPIGKEPVEADGGSVKHAGKTIGFCCKGCIERFEGWSKADRDAFVGLAMTKSEPGRAEYEKQMADAPVRKGDPYMLDVCPISGEKLGGMGDPIVKIYDGREVRFCCAGCIPDFEADLAASWAKVDKLIIKRQMPYYPLKTCVVSGEDLASEEMGETINFVYNNRLVRLCCKGCRTDFLDAPKKFIKMLDKAAIAQQREAYPVSTCLVSGEDLGSEEMGDTIEKVYGNRLIKFCCKMCVRKFEKNPAPIVAKLDKAWKDRHAMHGEGDGHGKHDGEKTEGSKSDHGGDGHDHGAHGGG